MLVHVNKGLFCMLDISKNGRIKDIMGESHPSILVGTKSVSSSTVPSSKAAAVVPVAAGVDSSVANTSGSATAAVAAAVATSPSGCLTALDSSATSRCGEDS